MYRLLVFLFVFFLCLSCHRENTTPNEKQRVDSVLTVNADQLFGNPQKVQNNLKHLQSTLTDSANWYKTEVFVATSYFLLSDTISSQHRYNHILNWCKRNPDQTEVAGLLWNHLGVNRIYIGDVRNSQECYQRSFDNLNTPPKNKVLISTTINLADTYFQRGNTPLAAQYYRYALFLADSLHEERNRTSILCGLGQVYSELENFEQAHLAFRAAAKKIDKEGTYTQFFYYFALGNCHYFEKNYIQSLQMFQKALKRAKQMQNNFGTLCCLANIAEIYLMQDSVSQANTYLHTCQNIIKENHIPLTPSYTFYINSLLSDLSIADGREKNIDKYVYAPINTNEINSLRYLMLHYKRLQHYCKRLNKWKEAYYCQEQADKYADTLSNLKARNTVAELGKRYQRDTTLLHQQVVLTNYQVKTTQQEKYIIVAALVVIILILFTILAFTVYRRNALKRQNKQTERITELRMSVVRNRVSPHYVFNVLGTIIPKLQRYPELVEPTEMLIDVLRGNLLSSGKIAVPLCDEIALVERFIELYHYSKNPYPIVVWDIANNLKESRELIPSMSIQIPLENALKHAFTSLNSECQINITIELHDKQLVLSVTDNGQGYNPGMSKRTERDTGTGILLINRTLHILNKYNKQPAHFSITNIQPHGTQTRLTQPLGYDFSTFS